MFKNKLKIGSGVYTVPEIAHILRLPYHKVNLWVNKYWDGELGKAFEGQYSWNINNSKAINFQTLIEFHVLILFADSGVKTRDVLNAHKELSQKYNTPYPFSSKEILEKIKTVGKKIFLEIGEDTISLDGTKQLNLTLIKQFFKNLEFGNDSIASKFWPLGKNKSIIVDPNRQFGHPLIESTNIYPETIFNLYKSGEPIEFIAFMYDLKTKEINDAIEFCKKAA